MSIALVASCLVGLDARVASGLGLDVLDPTVATTYQLIGKVTTNANGSTEPNRSSHVTTPNSKKNNPDSSQGGLSLKQVSPAMSMASQSTMEPLATLAPIDNVSLGDYTQLLSVSPYMYEVRSVADVKAHMRQIGVVPLQASESGWRLFNVNWKWWLIYLGGLGVVIRGGFLVLRQRIAKQVVGNGSIGEDFS